MTKREPPRIAVYGDAMLDVTIRKPNYRKSQEHPEICVFPVPDPAQFTRQNGVVDDDSDCALGGAANVAANLRALGCEVTLYCPVAVDAWGNVLAATCELYGVHLVPTGGADRTTVKVRYYSNDRLVSRIDHDGRCNPENVALPSPEILNSHDAVILTDYGKGAFNYETAKYWVELFSQAGKKVFVDPKAGSVCMWLGIKKIDTFLLNWYEATELAKFIDMEVHDELGRYPSTTTIEKLARRLLSIVNSYALVLKLGAYGSVLVEDYVTIDEFDPELDYALGDVRGYTDHLGKHYYATHRINAVNPLEVFDVQGAGDTYIAAYARSVMCDLSSHDAALFASTAAGIAVGKKGTAVVYIEDVVHALHGIIESSQSTSTLNARVVSMRSAADSVRRLQAFGFSVGYTNGCFDLRIHKGHLHTINAARKQCDFLFVGVDSDERVKMLKGPNRPINEAYDRASAVAALCGVHCVFVFDDDPEVVLRTLKPDVLIKGGEYTRNNVPEAKALDEWGGVLEIVGTVQAESTTDLINRVRR